MVTSSARDRRSPPCAWTMRTALRRPITVLDAACARLHPSSRRAGWITVLGYSAPESTVMSSIPTARTVKALSSSGCGRCSVALGYRGEPTGGFATRMHRWSALLR